MKNFKFIITISVLFLMLFSTTYVVLILPKADNVQSKANIALVNEDVGYQTKEMNFDFGSQFTTSLANSDDNNVTVTSRTDALEQLELDKYDLVLIVTQSFSNDIMSYDNAKPEVASVEYYVNPNSSKIDFLNNTLAKENIHKLINTNVNKSFTKEIMHKFDNMKTSSKEVLDEQEEYQASFSNNVVKPYVSTDEEFDTVLSSVSSQQTTVSNFGTGMATYERQVDGNINTTKKSVENFDEFYTQILENRDTLSDVQNFYSTISSDLADLKSSYETNNATNENLELTIHEMKVSTVKTELFRLKQNDYIDNDLTMKLNINNTIKTRLEDSELLSDILIDLKNTNENNSRAASYISEVEEDLNSIATVVNSTFSAVTPTNSIYTRVENEIVKSCEQLDTTETTVLTRGISNETEEMTDVKDFCNALNIESTSSVIGSDMKIELLLSTTFDKTVAEMNESLQAMPCSLTTCTVTDLKSVVLNTPLQERELKSTYITILNAKSSTINNQIDNLNIYKSELESLASGSIDPNLVQYNEDTKSYEVIEIDPSNIDALYVNGTGTNNEIIAKLEEFNNNMNDLNGGALTFIDTYTNDINTSSEEFNEFVGFYDSQGIEAEVIAQQQKTVLDSLVKLAEDSKVQAQAVEVIQADGEKILESSKVASAKSDSNKSLLDKTSAIYNDLVNKNKEYVTNFNDEYTSSKLGAMDNDKFYDNYSNPVSFIDNGAMFNFGSVIPFLIILLLAFYTIIISYIYNQFKTTHVSDSDHDEASIYKSNIKQLIFLVITAFIASFIVAYIGSPAVSLTKSMAGVWFASIIFIGIALTLLFYMLLTRFKSVGMIIIGAMMILYIISNSILDLAFSGKAVNNLMYINPLAYFEIFMKNVVYGASQNVLLFIIVLIVIIGSSIALIITNRTRMEKRLNETA